MINKERVKELANQYIVKADIGTEMISLIVTTVANVIAAYYNLNTIDEVFEDTRTNDEEFSIFMDVTRECLNKAICEVLS